MNPAGKDTPRDEQEVAWPQGTIILADSFVTSREL